MNKKKLLLISGLSVLVMLFGGCGSNDQSKNPEIQNAPLDRRIGVIKSLGNVVSDQGTHILQLDNGDTIFLRSLNINLDDTKYSNKTVEVRGVMTYNKSSKALMNVENIDILDDQFVTDSTVSKLWQTYDSSTEYSIKFRSDFVKEESDNTVTFTREVTPEKDESTNPSDLAASSSPASTTSTQEKPESKVENLTYVITIKTLAKDDTRKDLKTYLGITSEDPKVLLSKGLVLSRVGTQSLQGYKKQINATLTYYVEDSKNIYEVDFESPASEKSLEYENLFYEMLASFTLKDASISTTATDETTTEDKTDSSTAEKKTEDIDSPGLTTPQTVGEPEKEEASDPVAVTVAPENYTIYTSDTVGFSVQYPKSWYFSGSAPTEAGVSRHYDFGKDSFENDGGTGLVSMDIFSGDKTDGNKMTINGKTVYKNESNGIVYYYAVKDGKTYRFSGSTSVNDVLLNMVSSI